MTTPTPEQKERLERLRDPDPEMKWGAVHPDIFRALDEAADELEAAWARIEEIAGIFDRMHEQYCDQNQQIARIEKLSEEYDIEFGKMLIAIKTIASSLSQDVDTAGAGKGLFNLADHIESERKRIKSI